MEGPGAVFSATAPTVDLVNLYLAVPAKKRRALVAFTKKLAITVALVLALPAAPALAVVNPDPVLSRSVPSAVVALHFSSDLSPRSQFCTGTLVDKSWVLTAAHCIFESFAPGEISVVAKVGSDRVDRTVSLIRVHPKYKITKNGTNADLALLRLSAPLYGVTPIAPARPSEARSGIYQADLVLYGWGLVERGYSKEDLDKPAVTPLKPKAARQLEIPSDKVGINYSEEGHLPTLNKTPSGLVQGSCYGDSGGPVVAYAAGKTRLVGVVSYGASDCLADVPGINTKVAPLWKWISRTMGSNRQG